MNRKTFFRALLVGTSAIGTATLVDNGLNKIAEITHQQSTFQARMSSVKRVTRMARKTGLWPMARQIEYAKDSRIYQLAARGYGVLIAHNDRPALMFDSPAAATYFIGQHRGLYIIGGNHVVARRYDEDIRMRY